MAESLGRCMLRRADTATCTQGRELHAHQRLVKHGITITGYLCGPEDGAFCSEMHMHKVSEFHAIR